MYRQLGGGKLKANLPRFTMLGKSYLAVSELVGGESASALGRRITAPANNGIFQGIGIGLYTPWTFHSSGFQ